MTGKISTTGFLAFEALAIPGMQPHDTKGTMKPCVLARFDVVPRLPSNHEDEAKWPHIFWSSFGHIGVEARGEMNR